VRCARQRLLVRLSVETPHLLRAFLLLLQCPPPDRELPCLAFRQSVLNRSSVLLLLLVDNLQPSLGIQALNDFRLLLLDKVPITRKGSLQSISRASPSTLQYLPRRLPTLPLPHLQFESIRTGKKTIRRTNAKVSNARSHRSNVKNRSQLWRMK